MLAANDASIRQVAIPSEHGGWSLTLEPAILGLIVAPSRAGVALAAAALLGVLLRTPLKLVFVDRRRGRSLRRTELATWAAAGYLVLLTTAFAIAAALGEPLFCQPLIIALPLFAIEFAYDLRS